MKIQMQIIQKTQTLRATTFSNKIVYIQRWFYTVAGAAYATGPAPSRVPRFRLKVYDAILLIIIYIFSLAGALSPRWRGAL